MIRSHLWSVRYTLPKDEAKGRKWAKNGNATCVADTAEGAIALLKLAHEDATIFNVNHQGGGAETYVEERHLLLMGAVQS